ncbi:hypothetical protein OA92_15360 [Marinomonas sp. SBI22]|uniref:hypothetical protein n=1 Tax=unclassified Marinomonas TaxID=196814 RepID=UPI0007AF071F|nr:MULTISPECIES: hypothetical protein [unclassified Marinomonas]KZM40955.1 hypothetical protein OA92_15360 [Marinomonas sp. SBI22]KZM42795.1 hypothetical protein OA91_13565 [Marinomonas sp. SBI8L]
MKILKDVFVSHTGEQFSKDLTEFYVDLSGIKHVSRQHASDQVMSCHFNDALVKDNGVWRVRNADDDYQDAYQAVDDARQAAYTARVRPLLEEAEIKAHLGESDEYARLMDLAVTERMDIQAELPWPEVLVNVATEASVDESP